MKTAVPHRSLSGRGMAVFLFSVTFGEYRGPKGNPRYSACGAATATRRFICSAIQTIRTISTSKKTGSR